MKGILDIESDGASIKSKCVRIANEFRSSRPDHEFTRWFNEIEAHIYSQHERLIKALYEVERLKKQLSEINNEVEIDFEDIGSLTNQKKIEFITDDDYIKRPLQSKTFNDETTSKPPF
jgi:argonaute-like protein implicated in RNA metabolism and viral defense